MPTGYLRNRRAMRELREFAHKSGRIPQKAAAKTTSPPIDASNYKDRLPLGIGCVIEQAARAAFEAVRQLNAEQGIRWGTFNEEKQRANGYINAVLQYFESPAESVTVQHNRWCDAKMAAGWVLGDALDPDQKTHPDLVPFSQLSDTSKAKVCAFFGVCEAIIKPFTKENKQ